MCNSERKTANKNPIFIHTFHCLKANVIQPLTCIWSVAIPKLTFTYLTERAAIPEDAVVQKYFDELPCFSHDIFATLSIKNAGVAPLGDTRLSATIYNSRIYVIHAWYTQFASVLSVFHSLMCQDVRRGFRQMALYAIAILRWSECFVRYDLNN